MKTFLTITGVILFFFFCYLLGASISMWADGLNVFKLNFPNNSAKNWNLPNGYKLLYCKKTNDYEIHLPSEVFTDARLNCSKLGLINAFLDLSIREQATPFSDSCKAKYFAKYYYDLHHPINNADCYKPLTK